MQDITARAPESEEPARLRAGRDPDAGAGHRREHGRVHGRSTRVLLAPLPYANPRDVVVLNEQTPRLPERVRHALQLRRLARAREVVRRASGPSAATSMTIGRRRRARARARQDDLARGCCPLLGVRRREGRGFGRE